MSVILTDGFGVVSDELLDNCGADSSVFHQAGGGVPEAMKGKLGNGAFRGTAFAVLLAPVRAFGDKAGSAEDAIELVGEGADGAFFLNYGKSHRKQRSRFGHISHGLAPEPPQQGWSDG